MPSNQECTHKAEQIQMFFDQEATRLAKETQFVQRQSKLTGTHFAQTLVWGWLQNPSASLTELAQVSTRSGVSISAEGLHQRINERAVAFMEQLSHRTLTYFRETTRLPLEGLKQFTQVNLVDSTTIKLPDELRPHFRGTAMSGGDSVMKVQLSYDYLSGQVNAFEVEAGACADQKSGLPIRCASQGSLTIMDLGYFKQQTFEQIDQQGAYFISRLQSQVGLYESADAAKALKVLAYLQDLEQQAGEFETLMGSRTRLPVRVVFVKLPDPVAAARRRKARLKAKRRGQTVTKRHLAWQAWAIFVTNVPAETLSIQHIVLLYQIRWQIELIFKVWKSQARVKMTGHYRLERILCQFYARLIGVMLWQHVFAPYRLWQGREISFVKAFRLAQQYSALILHALTWTPHTLSGLLANLIDDLRRFALHSKRRKSRSTWQQIFQEFS